MLLSTRSNYVFPRTGCKILYTNRIFYDDVGEAAIAMEILLSQEISISISLDDLPGNNTASAVEPGPISYDRVYKHVSRGFSGGTGGRNKFKMLLMAEDEETGLTILPFLELEDVMLIKRLSEPIPRPTLPPSRVPTRLPTNAIVETNQPSTVAPTMTPMKTPSSSPTSPTVPSRSPQQQTKLPGDSILTNSPTSGYGRPLAPGKGDITIDEFPSPGPGPAIDRSSGPQGSENQDDIIPIAVVAAAAGAVAGIFVVALLSLYRYRKELQEYQKRDRDRTCSQLPVATAVPTEMKKERGKKGWGSINRAHVIPNGPRARESMAPKQHLVGARPPPTIVVNDEERSLAESTLGDRTAGRRLWSVPPPPVQFLQSSWIPGEGRRGRIPSGPVPGGSVAISQISSLHSGTIGAGNGADTIGEFSLEAAIKDDDSSSCNEEDGGDDQSTMNRGEDITARLAESIADDGNDHGVSGGSGDQRRLPVPSENSSSEAADVALPTISEAASSATAPNSTPSSLVGTASLFEASTLSLSDEATGTSESFATNNVSANVSHVTPDHYKGHPEPPLDLTPRISGGGGGPFKSPPHILPGQDEYIYTENTENNEEASNSDDLSYTLPQTMTPERKRSVVSESSSRPWSRAFAEGTAAVLSASFRGAENLKLPSSAPPQASRCGTPHPDESLGDFPELGPVTDPPASDHMTHVDNLEVINVSDTSLSEMEEGSQSKSTEAPNNYPRRTTPTSKENAESGTDDHRWLLKAVAGALGPPAKGADSESLSGRSNQSLVSAQSAPVWPSTSGPSKRRKSSRRSSTRSVCSRSSRQSQRSQGSEESRSIKTDLQRLEVQLKLLNDREKEELPTGFGVSGEIKPAPPPPPPPPPVSPQSRHSATSSVRLDIRAPPGRLGVILANRSDDQPGTVVSALRTSSALVGKILPGDVLVAIDGLDVSEMHVSEVTAIMSNKSQQEKILTVVTPSKSEENTGNEGSK